MRWEDFEKIYPRSKVKGHCTFAKHDSFQLYLWLGMFLGNDIWWEGLVWIDKYCYTTMEVKGLSTRSKVTKMLLNILMLSHYLSLEGQRSLNFGWNCEFLAISLSRNVSKIYYLVVWDWYEIQITLIKNATIEVKGQSGRSKVTKMRLNKFCTHNARLLLAKNIQ